MTGFSSISGRFLISLMVISGKIDDYSMDEPPVTIQQAREATVSAPV